MNSRLSSARASASRRCQAGSILKKVNLAKVRSGAAMTMAMLVLATALPGTASAAGPRQPAVIVAVVPPATTATELGSVPGMALGLLSAGVGPVPPSQTYLDASQGNRVNPELYGSSPPAVRLRRTGGGLAVPRSAWGRVRARAAGVPADIVPGLLGSTLGRAGVPSRAAPDAGAAAVLGVNQGGRIDTSDRGCGAGAVERSVGSGRRQNRVCAGLTVLRTS